MKKAIAFLLILCVFLASCGGSPAESSSEEASVTELSEEISKEFSEVISDLSEESKMEKTYKYYALGDSIAAGYALEDASTQCYGALFAKKCGNVDFVNYAVSGDDTSDMLSRLKQIDISDGDLITVSICANNILGTVINCFYSLLASYGNGIFEKTVSEFISGSVSDEVIAFINDIKSAFTSEETETKIVSGLEKAAKELPEILQKIKAMAPNAKIIVQTIYNPYKGIHLVSPDGTIDFDVESIGDGIVRRLNEVIVAVCNAENTEILDVYTAFEKSSADNVNAGLSLSELGFSVDPHPNTHGHKLISNLLYEKWNEINK